MTRCPHCFTPISPDWYAFRCTNPSCPEEVDASLSAYRGIETRDRRVVEIQGAPPQRVVCPTCRGPADQEVCAVCHFGLVAGWRSCTTTCLAMAGARDSGKSIYIAVLVKQAELWCEEAGRAFVALDQRTEEQYRKVYEEPLFRARGFLPPTPPVAARDAAHREPMIFDMGDFRGTHHMLVLRDVAGEDLEKPPADLRPFRFFAQADVIAFLFDPLHLDEIQGQLEGVTRPRILDSGDPLTVLRNLVRLVRGGAALGSQKVPTPLALVLAKFDALAELATIEGAPLAEIMRNPGASFNLDPGMDPSFDRADAARLQAEVQSLLVRLRAQTLLNLVDDAFQERWLFGVSSLGAVPGDNGLVSQRGIAPFRVLDPLKWALARTGVISVE